MGFHKDTEDAVWIFFSEKRVSDEEQIYTSSRCRRTVTQEAQPCSSMKPRLINARTTCLECRISQGNTLHHVRIAVVKKLYTVMELTIQKMWFLAVAL